jgi:hypothetical protein
VSARRVPALLVLCLTLVSTAGCGNDRGTERTAGPGAGLAPVPDERFQAHRYRAAGLSLELPRNVRVARAERPGVFRAALGEGFVSAFAYRRREQLPRNARELAQARRRLVRAVRRRARGYRLVSSRVTRVDGARAIELVGDQTISQRRLRTRSLHAFRGSAEYVIEVAAPVEYFRRFDGGVTPRLRRTLNLTGRVRLRAR